MLTFKRTTFLIIFALLAKFNYGQTYSSQASDKEVCDFLNWMTKNDEKHDEEPRFKKKRVSKKIYKWDIGSLAADLEEYTLILKYSHRDSLSDTLFSMNERHNLFGQIRLQSDTVWRNKIKHARLINGGQKKANRYYYSIPIYTIDKKFLIIRKEYYCGSLCAYGGYYIYCKTGGTWKYVSCFGTWMS